MNGEYAAAIEAERLAWLNLRRASENALVASLRVVWDGDEDALRLAQIAEIREDIERNRWHIALDRLGEACQRFG